jgi:hypothetical protein
MSPRKLTTGVLFRGPRHSFTRNPQARSHVRTVFTRTTQIVGQKPNHGKPANGASQLLGYQPVNDHSAELISSQSKANEYPSPSERVRGETRISISSQVKFNGYPSRDLSSYRKPLLPLAGIHGPSKYKQGTLIQPRFRKFGTAFLLIHSVTAHACFQRRNQNTVNLC